MHPCDLFHWREQKATAGSWQVVDIMIARSNNAVMDGDFSLEAGSAGNNPLYKNRIRTESTRSQDLSSCPKLPALPAFVPNR